MNDERTLESLREDYSQALLENQKAKEHYASLLDSKASDRSIPQNDSIRGALDIHLEVLRLRKQHQYLQSLSHYIDEADAIAENAGIFEPHRSIPENLEGLSVLEDDRKLSSMLEEARSLTQNLEIALLQARHQLKREKALLEVIETQRKGTSPAPPSNNARLQALQVTRAELTSWIESTLAKCDSPIPKIEILEPSSSNESREEILKDIDLQYEQYLTARKRAIYTQQVLSRPLPNEPSVTPTPSHRQPSASYPPLQQPQHHKQKSTHDNKSVDLMSTSLSQIEANVLPLQTHQKLLDTYTTYLLNQLTQSKSSLTETLHRLSDESHLLPSYPLLANSSRFQNARAALSKAYPAPAIPTPSLTEPGKKRNPQVEAGKPQLTDPFGPSNNTATATEEEIIQLLQAWVFASEAATTNAKETIAAHVAQGHAALEKAEGHIQEIQQTELAWKEVAKINAMRT